MKNIWVLGLYLAFSFQTSSKETVLVIDSYHKTYPWVVSYRKGIEHVLFPSHDVIYHEMNTKRIPPADFEKAALAAWEYILTTQPSHILLADDNAVRLLGPTLSQHNIPFTFFGVNANPRVYGITPSKNIGGVLERVLVKRATLSMAELTPIRRALVLFDNGFTSQTLFQNTFQSLPEHTYSGIEVEVKCITYYDDWKRLVIDAKNLGYDAIFLGLYQSLIDEEGNAIPEDEALQWLSKHSPVPPFAFWDYAVGKDKTIGGLVISGFEIGSKAAQLLMRMYHEEKREKLPEVTYNMTMLFSRAQLKKWNIVVNINERKGFQFVD